jgi:hypothetical protein
MPDGRFDVVGNDARVTVTWNDVLGGAATTLEVLGPKTSVLGNARQHP